jgi:hypothetical protein
MDAATWVALAAALLATSIAVTVPWVTFRLAMRQDHVRWVREQRSQLYADLLGEVYSEKEWLEVESADEATRERVRPYLTDKRLPDAERAQLGIRAAIFASQAVNLLFNQYSREALQLRVLSRAGRANPGRAHARIDELVSELRKTIRRELGADHVFLDGQGLPAAANGDPDARGGVMPPDFSPAGREAR